MRRRWSPSCSTGTSNRRQPSTGSPARLTDLGVPAPRGGPRWNTASVRGILRNPAYAGRALSNRTQVAPARGRKSAMLPAGPGESHAPRPEEDWIAVPVPPVVSEETFAQVQAKLDANQQGAARNTRHEYLLRALISCGACRLGCTGRQTAAGYRYYLCRGRTDPLRVAQGQRCTARYIPAGQLDELVWADLCALLTDPAQVTRALARAQGGAWLPQELQARQATIGQALGQLERQQQRLLDAYLAEVIALAELDRSRGEGSPRARLGHYYDDRFDSGYRSILLEATGNRGGAIQA